MRHGRTTFTIALLATIAATTAVPAAFADSGVAAGADSSAAAVESSKPTNDTSAPAPAPVTESVAPAPAPAPAPATTTSTPQTVTAPVTATPVAQPAPATPDAPAVPDEPVRNRPTTPVDVPGEQPRPGGGAQLPFTGPGDVLLAVLLALLAGSGGVLLLAGAAGREEIDGLNRRTLASPSGFRLAYRDLLKQQIGG